MKKGMYLTILTGLILFSMSFFILVDPAQYLTVKPGIKLELENPLFAVKDNDLNIFVIDNSKRRISKINTAGYLDFTIDGGSRDEKRFFYANELAVDELGYLYVVNWVLDKRGFYMEREEVLRYTPQGKFDKLIYRKTYEENEKVSEIVQRGRFSGIVAYAGLVRWIVVDKIGIHTVTVSIDKGALERHTVRSIDNADLLVSNVWINNSGVIVYSTKKGQILKGTILSNDDLIVYDADSYSSDKSRSVPWSVVCDSKGDVYFTDLTKKSVQYIDTKGIRPLINKEILTKDGVVTLDFIFYRLAIARNDALTVCNEYYIVSFDKHGPLATPVDGGKYKSSYIIKQTFRWILLIINLLLIPLFLRMFFVNIMRRRVSLVIKQLLIFTPLLLLSIILISYVIIQNFSIRFKDESLNKIAAMVQMIPKTIDKDLIKVVKSQRDYMSDEYMELRDQLKDALNNNRDEWNNSFYFVLYRVIDDVLYGFMYLNGEIGVFYPFSYFEDTEGAYRRAYRGDIAIESISDSTGSWLYGVGPVKDDSGQIIAILEVGTDLYSFNEGNRLLLQNMIRIIIIVSIVFICLFVVVTLILLQSIRILRDGVSNISNGRWDTKVQVSNTNDEIADLSNGFNIMSNYILNYVNQIVKLNEGYKKFVPEQFINYLDKKSVTDLNLGDQVQKDMTVMFSDIRSFTSMSEKMTPKENFDFLNDYLSRVGPSVRNYNGFIDKYIGDAIMALYPACADDGLRSSLEILNRLYSFNLERMDKNLEPIKVGMGLHTGNLMLGILGEQERMAGTVISDSVNLASRLEGLTKYFGATIIISETTFHGLKSKELYLYRTLGHIKVKGKSGSIEIFEVMDGLTGENKLKKINGKQFFEDGVKFYREKNINSAFRSFAETLKANPDDKAAMVYYSVCKAIISKGIPQSFDGTITMNTK